tara:strand:+ start:1051 stop:4179 length:3129 start_codon:yes stop_codon:yes gene_type:complete
MVVANSQYEATVTKKKQFVPLGTNVEIFDINIKNGTSTINMNLKTVTLVRNSGLDMTNYESITIYQDSNDSDTFTSEDLSNITAQVQNPSGDSILLSPDNTNNFKTIEQDRDQRFFVVVKFKSDTLPNETQELQITTVEVCDTNESCDDKEPNQLRTITSTALIASEAPDIEPDFIFPGSEDIPIAFLTVQASGNNVDKLKMTINDANGNFIGDSGVTEVLLARETKIDFILNPNAGDYVRYDILGGSTELIQKVTPQTVDNWSETGVTLNEWDLNEIDKDEVNPYGIWLAYNFGNSIVVTENSKLLVTISGEEDFIGYQDTESSLTITTLNIALEIPFAGIEISNIRKISGSSVYDVNTAIPALAFSLKSHQTSTTVNTITIINNGSIPFHASTNPAENINKIRIYLDKGGGEFSSQDDELVGELVLNGTGQQTNKVAPVPLIVNNIPKDVQIETYNEIQNNVKTFFVVYDISTDLVSQDLSTKNYVTAEIGNIAATGNNGIRDVPFLASVATNDNPLSTDPVASIDLTDTVIQIVETQDISPSNVYDGETKVPMLYLKFRSDSQVQTGRVKIKNSQANFYSKSNGVKKVWIYEDKNSNKELDNGDKFLRSTTKFTDPKEAVLENIEFNFENEFLILYDVGLLASEQGSRKSFASQINDIEIVDGTTSVSGVLPSLEVAEVNPVNNPLTSIQVVNVTETTTTFNIEFQIENQSGINLNINEIKPKFYLGDKGGLDISYEFNTSISNESGSEAFTLNNGEVKVINFNCLHQIAYSQGSVIIDAYVNYQKVGSPNQEIILQRYQDGLGDWNLVGSPSFERLITSDTNTANIPPSHIKHPIKICSNKSTSSCTNFVDGSSIGKDKILSLELVDASVIDESSIILKRGNTSLFQKEELNKAINGFTLDLSANLLQFYVGQNSTDISLEMSDLSGNDLNLTTLSYLISDSFEIVNPLFYPNPYVLGSNNLNLGFSVSQDNSTVKLYIYNHLGQEVFNYSDLFNSGFNTISISESEKFMIPGIFICRLIIEEDGNALSAKTTKLVIY